MLPCTVTTLHGPPPSWFRSNLSQCFPMLTNLKLILGEWEEFESTDMIPSTINTLYINSSVSFKTGTLPDSITDLILLNYRSGLLSPTANYHSLTISLTDYNNKVTTLLKPGTLPANIKHLGFKDFNQPINPGCIPKGVCSITFDHTFDELIKPNALPPSVKKLRMVNPNYQFPIGALSHVEKLRLFDYHHELTKDNIPSVRELTIYTRYFYKWSIKDLPNNVISIKILESRHKTYKLIRIDENTFLSKDCFISKSIADVFLTSVVWYELNKNKKFEEFSDQ